MTRLFSFFIIGVLIVSFAYSCKRADDSQPDSKEKKAVQDETKTVTSKPDRKSDDKRKTPVIVRNGNLPSFADLVEALKPTVVNISTTSVVKPRGFFQGPNPLMGKMTRLKISSNVFSEIPPSRNLKDRAWVRDL